MRGSERLLPRGAVAALSGGAFACALFACNALIGLDDFEKASCVGADCHDASFDAGEGGTIVDSDVPLPDAGEGADPVAWARWPMPNYDDKSDGGHPNRSRYEAAADGFVTDAITKLVWRTAGTKEAVTYEQAEKVCGEGARLPKRIELVSLLDLAQASAKLDPVAFPGAASGEYWTSSEQRPLTTDPRRWVVDFEDGAVLTRATKSAKAYVRCVKGASP